MYSHTDHSHANQISTFGHNFLGSKLMPPPQTVKVNKCRKRLTGRDMLKNILIGSHRDTPTVHFQIKNAIQSFKYPLIDHEKRCTITVNGCKSDLAVAYGYFNPTSAGQLSCLQQVFTDNRRDGHVHAIYTLGKERKLFDGRLGQHKMIKLMLSTQSFDQDTWRKVAAFCFDDRYDVLQVQDCGSVARPSNFESNDKK